MPTRFDVHRRLRVLAGLLLAMGLALAWMSVTQTGALSCLHCFLAQRWVEATVAERGPRQSRPETQTDLSTRVPGRYSPDPTHVPQRLVADTYQAIVSAAVSPGDAPPAIVRPWVFRTHSVPAPPTLDAGSSQSLTILDPTIPGFRAPPSLVTT
jgi:hypothetical protein